MAYRAWKVAPAGSSNHQSYLEPGKAAFAAWQMASTNNVESCICHMGLGRLIATVRRDKETGRVTVKPKYDKFAWEAAQVVAAFEHLDADIL